MPLLGFLWGWTMFWIMHTGVIAVLAMVCARYTAFFMPVGDRGTRLIAVGTILVISGINYVGVRFGSTVQALYKQAGKLAAIALLVVAGLAFGSHGPMRLQHAAVSTSAVQRSVTVTGFLLALIAGVFTFGGWQNVDVPGRRNHRAGADQSRLAWCWASRLSRSATWPSTASISICFRSTASLPRSEWRQTRRSR